MELTSSHLFEEDLKQGAGKAAKGDYSKYRKPPPGIERSGTPRPGAPLVGQKVVEFGV